MADPSLVILLVEDENHKRFAVRYLTNCGIAIWAIRVESSPSGKGSAENWVRKRFAKEVGACRNRPAKTALIVMIDADTHTLQDRLRQLDQTLKDSKMRPVDPMSERIARLIPKRNIETWILCLNEQVVDEQIDYKQPGNAWSKLIPSATEKLHRWIRSSAKPPDRCVDSLRHGIEELRRLKI